MSQAKDEQLGLPELLQQAAGRAVEKRFIELDGRCLQPLKRCKDNKHVPRKGERAACTTFSATFTG